MEIREKAVSLYAGVYGGFNDTRFTEKSYSWVYLKSKPDDLTKGTFPLCA
ncbi:MAG: hypothetical protein HY884_06745 [Deltaproteobacteria bacterium]|nr:hypothetical protein [Deltaproteobacteria bacterium]